MKRSSPLRRRAPLRRRSWPARGGRRTAYARRERDLDRMGWVRTLPCCVAADETGLWAGPPPDACARHVETHHAGRRPVNHKAPDDTCIPLCDHHHDALTDRRGCFAGWEPAALRAWQDAQVQAHRRLYDEVRAGRAAVCW